MSRVDHDWILQDLERVAAEHALSFQTMFEIKLDECLYFSWSLVLYRWKPNATKPEREFSPKKNTDWYSKPKQSEINGLFVALSHAFKNGKSNERYVFDDFPKVTVLLQQSRADSLMTSHV